MLGLHPPHDPTVNTKTVESQVQPTQFNEADGHSSGSDSAEISFKYPPAFSGNCRKALISYKFSGKSDENDFEVWPVDFTEATTDCMWADIDRARWFSWFLAGSAKITIHQV